MWEYKKYLKKTQIINMSFVRAKIYASYWLEIEILILQNGIARLAETDFDTKIIWGDNLISNVCHAAALPVI